MNGLRIGVNALYLIPGGVGGTEIYLRSLLSALDGLAGDDRYFIFTNAETGADLAPASSRFHQLKQAVRAAHRPARILWEQIVLPLAVKRLELDVLLNPGFTSPVLCACPSVTVFHDLQHLRHPEHFRWFDLPFWRILLFASAHRSTLLLADSEATRADLLRFYRLPPSRIRVVPLGVDRDFFGINRRRNGALLLAVSTLHPHKNLERLLQAFARFRSNNPHFRLIVAGLKGFQTEALYNARAALGLSGSVEFTGWIARGELLELFAHASAFVYPSTFEGFGLPVLEALAAGLPTACSDIEPLRSITGEAALHFNPHDTDALYQALIRITSDHQLRDRLAVEGPRRAAQFSWTATAESTLQALREAVLLYDKKYL